MLTYSKPEVMKIGSPLEVVQGGEKEKHHLIDVVSPFLESTHPAYEADE